MPLQRDWWPQQINLGIPHQHNPAASPLGEAFEGRDPSSGELRWRGSRVDLVFGSNTQLRAIAEVYAQSDGAPRFLCDFVSAWVKVMEADRFDLKR